MNSLFALQPSEEMLHYKTHKQSMSKQKIRIIVHVYISYLAFMNSISVAEERHRRTMTDRLAIQTS